MSSCLEVLDVDRTLQQDRAALTIVERRRLVGPAPPHTLERIVPSGFGREVGLTPKLFARVRRLQAVLRRLEDPAQAPWVELALAHSYFDQAHLIRDFRRFTGLAPTAYLARRGSTLNHIELPEEG